MWTIRRACAVNGAVPAHAGQKSAPPTNRGLNHGTADHRDPLRRTHTVDIHEKRCLWYGVFRSRPVRVIVIHNHATLA